MEQQLKDKEITVGIDKPQEDLSNQFYIDDLKRLIKTNSTVPTHTPKKFLDCFWFYWDGTTTYRLYIYINNEWKYTTLS